LHPKIWGRIVNTLLRLKNSGDSQVSYFFRENYFELGSFSKLAFKTHRSYLVSINRLTTANPNA
jgi:hypothetical protein